MLERGREKIPIKEYLKRVSAINDAGRISIVRFLQVHGECCVCEIEKSLNIPHSRASRLLNTLYGVGFLSKRKDGLKTYYAINPEGWICEKMLETIKKIDIEVPKIKMGCGDEKP